MIRLALILGLVSLGHCALFTTQSRPTERLPNLESNCHSIQAFKEQATPLFPNEDQKLLNQWEVGTAPNAGQREVIIHLSQFFLKNCGQAQVIALTQTLVQFATTRVHNSEAEIQAFTAMATFLKSWAQEAGLHFKSHGQNDILQIDSGAADALITYVMHADVVPVAEKDETTGFPPGWNSSPFNPIIRDGKLIGRGTQDDKGPIAAAMVALKTLKAFNLEPSRRVTLLMGTDEESSWEHMSRFAKTYPPSQYTISVDAEFPVVFGQSGFVSWPLFAPSLPGSPPPSLGRILHVAGGQFLTQVPGDSILVLAPGVDQNYESFLKKVESAIAQVLTGFEKNAFEFHLHTDSGQRRIQLQCIGKATHSSKPEQGNNALWPIALVANKLPLAPSAELQILKVIATYFAHDLYGQSLGVAYESPTMGPLVSSATVIRSTKEGVNLSVNMRRPNTKTSDEFKALLDRALKTIQTTIAASIQSAPDAYVGKVHLADLKGGLVETLHRIYAKTTGDFHSKPHSVRGGTYAKLFKGAVDFGPSKPGDEYRGHAPDEYIRLDTLAELTEMLYESMIELMKQPARS